MLLTCILSLLAGCGVFMVGMNTLSDGLERSTGKGVKKLLGKTISEYAILKPKSILIDDDFRLSFHQPVDYGCFCNDCIKKFNDLHGFDFTRPELEYAILNNVTKNDKNVRKFWLEYNRSAIVELAKIISDSFINSADKATEGSSIQPIIPLGAPAASAASKRIFAVAIVQFFARGCGDIIKPFLVFKQIKALKIAVEVGFVVGITAAATPIDSAIRV